MHLPVLEHELNNTSSNRFRAKALACCTMAALRAWLLYMTWSLL